MGTLSVVTKTVDVNANISTKWSLTGEQGNRWLKGQLPIYSTDEDFFIYFEGL